MTDESRPAESFSSRVRRGKLAQWTVAYLAGAWLLLQFFALIGEIFAWPPVVARVLTVLLAVGLVAAVVLAWYHGERGEQRVTRMELAIFAVLALAVGVGVTMVRGQPGAAATPSSSAPASIPKSDQPSIAVLPFTNLSSDPENAYFAGGIHDELLTQLSRVPGLRVIARTTMRRYEGSQKSVREIAGELGVGAVMEGSVQRVGDRVRITAQLIDPATEGHLWAESYDREIADVFAVQSEVAKRVAASLQTALTPKQAEALDRRPTENAEAFALYLRGIDYLGRSRIEESFRTAARLLQRAVELDPQFAEAWAGLSWAEGNLYWFGYDPTAARLDEGRRAAARAYELAPELPLVRRAMALIHSRAREYDKALEFAEPLLAELPYSTGLASTTGAIYRRQGRWDDAVRLLERVHALDPASGGNLSDLGSTYSILHRFPQAEAMLKRAIELGPDDDPGTYSDLGAVYLRWRGDLKAARDAVARMPDRFVTQRALTLAWYDAAEGRYQEGLDRLVDVPPDVRSPLIIGIGIDGSGTALVEGVLLERLGRTTEARSRYRAAADALEGIVNARGFDVQGQTSYRSALALAYAGLGLKERAITTVQRSAHELPVSLDAMFGPRRLVDEAKVYAMVGEKDEAVGALKRALSVPIADTPASLRLDPLLASLRGYPPFEELMREREVR